MPFKKGQSGNPTGRPNGATNHLTKTVKSVVLEAFNKLQEHPTANIVTWAEKNPKDFYLIASKLIPTEVSAKVENTTPVIITLPNGKEIEF
jgi:hypothetical protein